MNGFSLKPDPWMEWIYQPSDPRYHEPATVRLRESRGAALRSCPMRVLQQAAMNDCLAEQKARQSGLKGEWQ